MSDFYKHTPKAPVSYVTSDGEIKKITLVPINNVKISNSFDIPYVRGIVGSLNAIISRFMHFAIYDAYGNKRTYPKAQDHIYLPYHQLSDMINRCESQSINIKNQLERLFDLDIKRAHEKFGANKFKLSERVIEFLYIFNHDQLNQFMEKHNITDSQDRYRLRQLYKFRVVRPSDANMNREQREQFYSFMKNKTHKDFNHFCSTNNKSIQSRIDKIELHIDLLSDKQKQQLNRIKSQIKQGITKLVNRFHWLLLKLEQFVTGMLKKSQITASETNREDVSPHSHAIDRNKTEGEMQKTHEVAATQLKDPEDVPFQDIVQVATYWNIMARGREMEFMFNLTDKKIQSIIALVKLNGKEKVLQAISNTGYLKLNSTLMWNSFTRDSYNPESRFNKIYNTTKFDSRFSEEQWRTLRGKQSKFYDKYAIPAGLFRRTRNLSREEKFKLYDLYTNPVFHDTIPTFTTKADAKSWFKSNIDNM